MDLEDGDCRARFLVRDGKFPALFDTVLSDSRVEVVLSGVQMPRMNSIMERWVQTCRRELLDRTLIWNQRHLLHALREFENFYNSHRPHQGIANARPLHPLPTSAAKPEQLAPPQHRSTRPAEWHPSRVPPRSMTCTDMVFAKRRGRLGLRWSVTGEHQRHRCGEDQHQVLDRGGGDAATGRRNPCSGMGVGHGAPTTCCRAERIGPASTATA